jgi:hypothetical protein
MLRNLAWLEPGQPFPPLKERDRIHRYVENEALFDGEHFGDELRTRDKAYQREGTIGVYQKCAKRISQVIGNFEDIISFPVLMNYQRLMSLKMADLVCGEYPSITGVTSKENQALKDVRDYTDFDAKLYSTAIDVSRYGDAIWRTYLDDTGRKTFTCWDPKEWYPVVSQDGTNTIVAHVLCWRQNFTESADGLPPDWHLFCQIHWNTADRVGSYEQREYKLDDTGSKILQQLSAKNVPTGLDTCAVFHLKAYSTTTTVYGYDDYMTVDSILSEIMARVGQISIILDKHADPNITGPVTMLSQDPRTGEYSLKMGKFFATSPGENEPKYMTWDGQLSAAFKQLEFLINQLYILSEMGAALLGGQDGSSNAISGTAMRFKMVNPLAKARRIANSMSRPVRRLFSELSSDAEVKDDATGGVQSNGVDLPALDSGAPGADQQALEEPLKLPIPYKRISIFWADGLPDDPRENIENCKLATGATKMMPLETGIMEYFGRTNEEAQQWIDKIQRETLANEALAQAAQPTAEGDPNKPGPQDGTGVNPQKKGSETGMNNFSSQSNKKPDDK